MSISLTALFAMMREDPKGAAALWKDNPILQFDKKELAMIMSGLSSLQLTRKDIKALIATRQTVRKTGKMTFSKDTLSKITVNTFGKNDEDVSTYLGPAIVPIFVVITGALGAFGLGYAIGKDVENAMDEPQSEPQGGEVCECSDGSIEITPN